MLEAAAIGVPDEQFGQRLSVFVVRRAGAELTEEDVKQYVRENLARYKVPREVMFIDELPRNPTGKVLKRELVGPLSDDAPDDRQPDPRRQCCLRADRGRRHALAPHARPAGPRLAARGKRDAVPRRVINSQCLYALRVRCSVHGPGSAGSGLGRADPAMAGAGRQGVP